MRRHLPNFFTLLNLASGSIGAIIALRGNLAHGALCINLGAFFDFLDGFLARLFCYPSPFGKQLDSLADLVTFGFLPTVIMYSLIELQTTSLHLPYIALLITLFSALRLARFNIDTRHHQVFVGLPTPANAIFISTLPFIMAADNHSWLKAWIAHAYTLTAMTILSSCLLVANIPFVAFKFTTYGWHPNRARYILLLATSLLILLFRTEGVVLSFLLYILCSSLLQRSPKRT